ncbi:agamous-like MADS-box protein AGL66 [Syzygium oleosum]|uniref:agamous-like MADS-box protein AGL66 n=1 Tax=Syzygium oleosum TaxID=219896 RepID=UPI0024BBDB22|nr:agamous-like MADS-box protein AGL66 [Syzygium oleosum]
MAWRVNASSHLLLAYIIPPLDSYLATAKSFPYRFPFLSSPSRVAMGRKKLTVKRIDNPAGQLVTYRKRKDGIVKKVAELSGLCGTDVGLIMFSPNGRMTSCAGSSSVENVFLRYLNLPDVLRGGSVENQEVLRQGLKHVKCEAQMLEAMTKMQALEEELKVLNRQQAEAQENIRSYHPELEEIRSVREAEVHIRFLNDAIRRIQHLKQAKLSMNELLPQESASFEVPAASVWDSNRATNNSAYSIQKRDRSDDEHRGEAAQHMSIGHLKPQAEWNISKGASTRGPNLQFALQGNRGKGTEC